MSESLQSIYRTGRPGHISSSRLCAAGWVALLTAVAMTAAAQTTQYKWVDSNGRVVYGDNPPRNARKIERLKADGGDADRNAALPFELRRAVERFPVTLYVSATECAACDNGRALLRTRGVPFDERIVRSEADVADFKRRGYGDQVPVLTVGSVVQRLFEPSGWQAALDAAGYPSTSRLPTGWVAATPRPLVEPTPAPVVQVSEPGGEAAPSAQPEPEVK